MKWWGWCWIGWEAFRWETNWWQRWSRCTAARWWRIM